jgi:NTP pyrophosphatase (non-canonical NTP hydrolase)
MAFEKFSDQRASDIKSTFDFLMEEIHTWAKEKGWWDVYRGTSNEKVYDPSLRSFGDQMANFHAELSEAWEEYRKSGYSKDMMIYSEDTQPEQVYNGLDAVRESGLKPEGLAVELADLIIRLMDTCGAYNIPIVEALILKMEYNANRPYRHGNNSWTSRFF